MTTDLDKLEQKLRESLEFAKQSRLDIINGGFGDGQTCICVISAYNLFNHLRICHGDFETGAYLKFIVDDFCITYRQAWNIVFGFDGNEWCGDDDGYVYYQLGEKLAKEFVYV